MAFDLGRIISDDVVDLADRIVTAGGYVDNRTLTALDRFIQTGVAEGWYSLLDEIWCPVGTSLAGSLEKLKYDTTNSVSALINNNFVAADYDQLTGFGTTNDADTSKYLQCGFIPSAIGMGDSSACAFAAAGAYPCQAVLGDSGVTNPGYSDVTISTAGTVAFNSAIPGTLSAANVDNLRVIGGSCYSGGTRSWNGGTLLADGWGASSGTWDSEIFIFKRRLDAAFYWGQGKMGFVAFGGNAVSADLGAKICRAIARLQVDIGRTAWQRRPTMLIIGDSTVVPTTGAHCQMAERTGYRLLNLAHNSVAVSSDGSGLPGQVDQADNFAANEYDFVVESLGMNDILQGITSATYQTDLGTVITALKKRKVGVMVTSLSYTTNALLATVDAYVAAAYAVAEANNAMFCNLSNVIRDKATPADWMTDGTHPTQAAYDEMAKRLILRYRGIVAREQIIDFGSISAGTSTDSSGITVEQVSVGDRVTVSCPAAIEAGLDVTAYVSATDTVKIRVSNNTAGAIDPGSAVFTVYVDVTS